MSYSFVYGKTLKKNSRNSRESDDKKEDYFYACNVGGL